MRCAIWYHLCNLKSVKNTNGGVLILVKLQASLKLTLLYGCFSRFLNCLNATKSRNAPQMSVTAHSVVFLPSECKPFIVVLRINIKQGKITK